MSSHWRKKASDLAENDPRIQAAIAGVKAEEEAARVSAEPTSSCWLPDRGVYVNSERGTPYAPHHDEERRFVFEDGPWRYGLLRGGEGSGKSVAGIVKDLERLRRGMSGIMVSPDFEHFKKSLWPEFRRWCPWDHVVESHRRRRSPEWSPQGPFALVFSNGATLYCGGIEDPTSWEGPNVSFAHLDEARRKKDASALKVLDGRVRIPGPDGEPPQAYLTTTPAKNYLFEYFGPITENDPYESFKRKALDVVMRTIDNAANLAAGYAEDRRSTLTEAEARALLEGAWEDIEDTERFIETMLWWDACREPLPPLDPYEPLVLAADAGVNDDSFALVATTRHPEDASLVAVRLARAWVPQGGRALDYDPIEAEIVRIAESYNVIELDYDPYQLHQMMTRLRRDHGINTRAFSQAAERLAADRGLRDLVLQRRIRHDGDPALRQHIDNANAKKAEEGAVRSLRIVKRAQSLKIDLAVATSMSAARCLQLPLD